MESKRCKGRGSCKVECKMYKGESKGGVEGVGGVSGGTRERILS